MTQISTEIVTVLGQRGSGKTSWVKKALPDLPRWIVWDTLSEYDGGVAMFDNLPDLYRYIEANHAGVFQAVYRSMAEDEVDELETVCRIAAAVGDCLLVVEEVDTYATPNLIPFELKKLLKVGRHYGVSLIGVSRRPAEINRLITSQSQRFVCFRIIEPLDVRYLRSIIGQGADGLGDLPDLSFIDWQHGKIERGVVVWQKEKKS